MSESQQSFPEPVRIPDNELDDLASTLAGVVADVREHQLLLDRLASEDTESATHQSVTAPADSAATPAAGKLGGPTSVFIVALGDTAYEAELAALRDWVNHILLPIYGREISSTRPWCDQWPEHPEAVARLHALWLAWQQLTDAEAGLAGPSTWHRDHLDHALAQLRAPDGPFAACSTSPARPNHRVLATPARSTAGLAPVAPGATSPPQLAPAPAVEQWRVR